MKNLLNTFKYDVKIEAKVIVSSFILTIIPIAFLGCFSYFYLISTLTEQAVNMSKVINQQINKNLEAYIEEIDKFSLTIAYNENINEFLDEQGGLETIFNFSERLKKKKEIEDILFNYLTIKNEIYSIHIYSEGIRFDSFKYGTLSEKYNYIEDKQFNNATLLGNDSFYVARNTEQFNEKFFTISLIKPVRSLYNFKEIGKILINIDPKVFEYLVKDANLTGDSQIMILDGKDNVLYSGKKLFIGRKLNTELFVNQQTKGNLTFVYNKFNGEKNIIMSETSKLTGWRSVVLIPYSQLTEKGRTVSAIILLMGFLLFILSFILSVFISNTIVIPVKKLGQSFKAFEKGDFKVTDYYAGRNEIGELWTGFNKMKIRIAELIEKIMLNENEKRKSDIKALQMQITPHFLYNTLNSIKYLALIHNVKSISIITNALINILKYLARNEGDFIAIRQELEILRQYVEIQNIRYLDSFELDIDVEEGLLDYEVLKFLLQPIVENSIFHGIVPSQGKGKIKITIFKQENTLKFCISDNGIGFKSSNSDKDDSGLENGGIGLRNIDNRIKLFYGESYGININSNLKQGAEVIIILPYMEGGTDV